MSISCVLEDIDPIFNILKDRRIFWICRHASFPKFSNQSISKISRLPTIFSKRIRDFLNHLELFGGLKVKYNCFKESWTRPKIRESSKWWGFGPKLILKVTSPKWSRIILRSFRAHLFLKFTVKFPAPDPNTDFPGFYMKTHPLHVRIGYWQRSAKWLRPAQRKDCEQSNARRWHPHQTVFRDGAYGIRL